MASSINVNRPGRFLGPHPRACKYFSKGQCTRGNSCQYYHETPPTNSSPGLRTIEIDLSDLESLNSAELEAFNLEDDGPVSLSELHPESIAYKKYQHPPTLSTQILNFKDRKSYSKSYLTPAYTHLQFGSGFQVTDSHIQDLLSCPSMLKSLEVFVIKGVDGSITTTGKGKKKKTIVTDPKPIEISNEPLITVIRQLRSLRVLHLIGCTKLDDYVFKAIAQSCPDLMELKLTGTPTHPGNLTAASPVYIVTKGPAYLPSIRQIHLQNQAIDSEGITLLSDARPLANILEGVQSTLPSKGAGLTLTSLEGIRVHHSSYVVALGEKKLKFKECFAPNWDVNKGEQPNEEAIEKLLAGVKELPGFWGELEESAKEAKVKKGEREAELGTDDHLEEGEVEDGIHHLEIVKGGESESQKLSDNLIFDLTDAIKRLHRDIADIV
ncbi:hypothetical protein TWF788_001906 [Orbilia oligospora]|uniref:C3H1-type domain-containing protein n=1 Tax=Orbilia oligospora TaxID=2813651 RepID=A0A6G1MH58_ORBOL|nr:hypothetical protein TWF788_001906 [Orbilia oligospora]KAF3198049.1 hypothetical protein TWF679_002408 [Orbilia oligospora]KAF3230214.1 hypothetical protein TWF191_010912 [Orbilia oligospora]KAF3256486.1 hypothetical protein TWF192_001910 [Orbilia oligospora]